MSFYVKKRVCLRLITVYLKNFFFHSKFQIAADILPASNLKTFKIIQEKQPNHPCKQPCFSTIDEMSADNEIGLKLNEEYESQGDLVEDAWGESSEFTNST